MIRTKEDLFEYIEADNWYYKEHYSDCDHRIFSLISDPQYELRKYKIYLRKEEYHLNNKGKLHVLKRLYYLRKKNKLGNKLGILIPPNTFKMGLMIMHHGEIIVNPNVKVGAYCVLHGGNCLGNNGKTQSAPVIGDHCDIGIGAKIIGGVELGNNVTVGANAVVTKSFGNDITLIGVPACEYKNKTD